ncbi:MAG: hypothetical protein E7252_07920 [Lachnospira sp.]|nr:hypothetical protein [Lachnospira sp.]
MKNIINKIVTLLIAVVMVCGISAIMYETVYAASAKFTGPTTVRAGDTITLTFTVSDNGKYALEGTLDYDSTKLTLNSISSLREGWEVERNDNTLIAYDNNMTNPLGTNTNVFQAVFKVNANVTAGTNLSVSIKNITSTTGSVQNSLGTVTYSVTVAKPLSQDNTLSALSVDGCTLSPTFAPNTTTYSIGEVDYSVSTLNVKATKSDANATVTVSGNRLAVGANTVTVTVTAENGSVKVYKINVTRKQDPNYVASGNADVANVTVSAGILSPKFDATITDYVVYLPFEQKGMRFEMRGTAKDNKAAGVKSAIIESLAEGNNKTKLVCTAENGTTKEYNVIVVVMPKYTGGEPSVGEPENPTSPPQDTGKPDEGESITQESNEKATDEDTLKEVGSSAKTTNGVPIWLKILLVVATTMIGLGVLYVIYIKSKK